MLKVDRESIVGVYVCLGSEGFNFKVRHRRLSANDLLEHQRLHGNQSTISVSWKPCMFCRG